MNIEDESEETSLVPSTRDEAALDVAAAVSSFAPWVGGPISAVLTGMSGQRRMKRVAEVLDHLSEDLKNFKSEASEQYVKTEDFEELLEKTLRQAAEERSEEKRRIYGQFLTDAITSPGQPYYEQIPILRLLEDLQPDHIRIIKALLENPNPNPPSMGSVSQTLQSRLPKMNLRTIEELARDLDDKRVTSVGQLGGMMTGHGAEDLRNRVMPVGHQLVKYLVEGSGA